MKISEILTENEIKKVKYLCCVFDAKTVYIDEVKYIVPLDEWKKKDLTNYHYCV